MDNVFVEILCRAFFRQKFAIEIPCDASDDLLHKLSIIQSVLDYSTLDDVRFDNEKTLQDFAASGTCLAETYYVFWDDDRYEDRWRPEHAIWDEAPAIKGVLDWVEDAHFCKEHRMDILSVDTLFAAIYDTELVESKVHKSAKNDLSLDFDDVFA